MKSLLTFVVLLSILAIHSPRVSAQVQLDGLYATSTALPLSDYAVENVFDEDPNTIWRTPKGIGPNEGIMIYFSKPTYVSRVGAEFVSNDQLSKVLSIEVYGDGRSFWNGSNMEATLSFLYIKIARVENTNRIESSVDGKDYIRQKFNENQAVGIKSLLIYNEEYDPYKVLPPKFVNGTIQSTSSLKPALAYGPSNLMDSRKDLGWAESVKGNGIGEAVTFKLSNPVRLTKLKIWNGYQRSPKHFSGNSRLKAFQFGLKGGNLTSYNIEDVSGAQTIDLQGPIEGTEFVLKVTDAYSGSKYQDLVISEIKFYDGDKPIVIKTNAEENRMKAMQSKGALATSFFDRNFEVWTSEQTKKESDKEYYAEYKWESKSLSLRSNNTFVLYTRETLSIEEYNSETNYENYEDDSKEVIADGNWELKEEGADYIKIRIFGKIYSPTSSAELYQGDVTSDNVRIFQDFLTLRKDKISGERFVRDLILKD